MSGPDVAVVGIGLHPFGRPDVPARAMGVQAVRAALADAGAGWVDVDFAVGGSRDGGNADAMVADLGLTGLPFLNVRNGCATGGAALVTAANTIRAGAGRLGVVVGFDRHTAGAFGSDPAAYGLGSWYAETGLMVTTQFFGMKIQRYMHDHGISRAALARVAARAFRNGARNPDAWRRKPLTEAEILAAPMIADPLTQFMFCSPGAGAVALVVAPGDEARRWSARPVYLRSAVVRTRRFGSFEVYSPSLALDREGSPTVDAARAAFAEAGIGPDEVGVAQLQDTDSGAEIMHLAECGLCQDGEQEEWLARGVTEIDGALPVNTDGGCLANGEPIGASGLRQVHEVVAQLQCRAGDRQVPGDPRVGFTHVYGAPGLSACTVLSR
ncbi:MAG TPA: thiolase family protein [Acidimicrobiia bacterium]|nr:thiolase family protein [Acidimicrobiia bacterium]